MNNLTVLNLSGKLVTDSREVAEVTNKPHNDLMKSIRTYIEYLGQGNFPHSDFFIESTYFNSQNKEQPCYLLTKKGCDMVANKMTGEKGILFTAEYVTQFEEMEQTLKTEQPQLSKEVQAIFVLDARTVKIENKVTDMENNMPLFNVECKELQALVRKIGTKSLGGYRSPAYNDKSIRTKIYKDIQHQLKREFGIIRYEGIKRVQLAAAREIVTNYRVPLFLHDDILILNEQTDLFKG